MEARRLTDPPIDDTYKLTIEQIKKEAEELHTAILEAIIYLRSNQDNIRPKIIKYEIILELQNMRVRALENYNTILRSNNRNAINKALIGLRRKKTSCLDLTKTIMLPPQPPVPNSTINILTSFAMNLKDYFSCPIAFTVQIENPAESTAAEEKTLLAHDRQLLPMSVSSAHTPRCRQF